MRALADRQSDEAVKQRIIKHLVAAYPDLPASVVEDAVAAASERLRTARVRVFVPIFIERFAREMLDRSDVDRHHGRARR
jgi:hypothetical protein